MRATSFGDPLGNAPVEMGPLIHPQAAARIAAMVETAVGAGAELLTGGKPQEINGGFYFEPTVLAGCAQDAEIMQKEIFGPVMPIHVVDDLDEAIAKSNDSDYGLTSSIYTARLANTLKACADLNFGETYVNRENFEAMQGFHAGARKSGIGGIGGADGKHGLLDSPRHRWSTSRTSTSRARRVRPVGEIDAVADLIRPISQARDARWRARRRSRGRARRILRIAAGRARRRGGQGRAERRIAFSADRPVPRRTSPTRSDRSTSGPIIAERNRSRSTTRRS
ncbi:MAG: aldehyde dehydrogenase family protein [Sphingomonas sp.]